MKFRMQHFCAFLSVVVLTTAAATAAAQQTSPAATPAAGASGPAAADCVRQVPRHDHGAERGTPMPRSRATACAPERAASGAARSANKPLHDHGKVHKNQ